MMKAVQQFPNEHCSMVILLANYSGFYHHSHKEKDLAFAATDKQSQQLSKPLVMLE